MTNSGSSTPFTGSGPHAGVATYFLASSSHHLFANSAVLTDLVVLDRPAVFASTVGAGRATASHVGRLVIHVAGQDDIVIDEIYYSPEARFNVLAERHLGKRGWVVDFLRGLSYAPAGREVLFLPRATPTLLGVQLAHRGPEPIGEPVEEGEGGDEAEDEKEDEADGEKDTRVRFAVKLVSWA